MGRAEEGHQELDRQEDRHFSFNHTGRWVHQLDLGANRWCSEFTNETSCLEFMRVALQCQVSAHENGRTSVKIALLAGNKERRR